MKKVIVPALLALTLLFSGCGSVFDREYLVVSDYVPPVQDSGEREDRVTVHDLNELKSALLAMVSAGESDGSIFFDSDYVGDVSEDLASACWQVRSQDALCAYCVENIAYELSKIVTYYEAHVTVSYSRVAESADNIVQLPYSAGAEDVIYTALDEGRSKQVILIERSTYSAEDMESLVSRVYHSYPASAPKEPLVSVTMLSGTGTQRLYEIRLRYGISATEQETRREELSRLRPFQDLDLEQVDAPERALLACRYIADNCRRVEDSQQNDVYSALIRGAANSEGLALAYVELCRQLEVDCQIVYGQRNWENHCWNIVMLEGDYYHVDPYICVSGDLDSGFLLKDVDMWTGCRWDVSAYPPCTGELSYARLLRDRD